MTSREVYVGALGRNMALNWGGDPDIGNVPARLSPLFPRTGARVPPYTLVTGWIQCGLLDGRKVDWGAQAARVTVPVLQELLSVCYGREYIPSELAEFVASLAPQGRYAIVAATLQQAHSKLARLIVPERIGRRVSSGF